MNQEQHQQISIAGVGHEVQPASQRESVRVDDGRRRLFRGAGAGVGVLLTVSAKTALGGTVCQSPSAMMSGNTSPRPGTGGTCSGGRSPGYWKVPQHSGSWNVAGGQYPTFKKTVVECAKGMGDLSIEDVRNHGTLLASVFPGAPSTYGLWAVLAFPNDPIFGNKGQLLRHLSAAWLNAGYFNASAAQYPISKAQVVAMWHAVKFGGLYCPPSMPNCGTKGWSADQVKSYIEGMYDLNAQISEPDLCKTT